MDLLRISSTGRGINYLPEYYAAAGGALARRGLEVQASPRDPWTGVLDDLAAGDADIVLGGVWVPAMYAGAGRELVALGQLNARFPMVLISRAPVADFTCDWLPGRTVLAPGAGGTAPYEFTAGVIREHGVDPGAIKFVRDLSTAMLVELFERGLGDAIIADPLTAERLTRSGAGYPAWRLADAGGPMPNSVYYTDRSRLDEVHERVVALMAGVVEAMTALRGGADPSDVIASEWPDAEQAPLVAAASRLAADGTWSGVRIDPDALDRWVGILHDRGLSLRRASYDELVDVRVADAVEAALGQSKIGASE
jgi:NitT/TauT family transport system substrate-binding protein